MFELQETEVSIHRWGEVIRGQTDDSRLQVNFVVFCGWPSSLLCNIVIFFINNQLEYQWSYIIQATEVW